MMLSEISNPSSRSSFISFPMTCRFVGTSNSSEMNCGVGGFGVGGGVGVFSGSSGSTIETEERFKSLEDLVVESCEDLGDRILAEESFLIDCRGPVTDPRALRVD